MDRFNQKVTTEYKLWKKALCVFLSVIIAFGTFVVLTVGSGRLQELLGIQSMLSAYAAEIVDTKGAVAVDQESMLADNHIIDLENRDGSNTIYLFSEPISYTDENGNLKTKDISVEKQADKVLQDKGYEYTNGQNDYRINFSTDSDKGLYIEFGESSYSIIPQGKLRTEGKQGVSAFLNENFDVFEYENIYGTGTTLKFYPQLNGVKDEIVLDKNIGQNIFSFELRTENCTAVLNEDGTVSLISKDDEESVQTFSAPFAYDSEYVEGDKNAHYIDCRYSLDRVDGNTYIMSVDVDKSWLESENTVYPVTIDPVTGNISNYKDAGIYSSATSRVIPYGNEALCCFGRTSNSEYGYGRVLNYFSWPDAIKKGAKINSAYIWERETTGRTTSTYVAPCLVKEHWVEGSVTWENRPDYYPTTTMAKRNINSKSTDKADNPYWYKFDISSAVKYWADGTYHNYGLLFRSSEEDTGNYNWRAFASKQHSTSSYRPYTVINYTNDATAPTVTSVTGNPTSWTNNNVTLTINGAKDNTGGAGLHATPYSFSTSKDSYSWQSGNAKTFSSNCTVYVSVRDALGNIRLVSTQTINKIDKTKPSVPTVTGNAENWTNDNVTLSVSSSDSQSGVAAYSFSTTENSYSWQTEKSKTYSENTTVFVYAKDNAGNISDAQKIVINKIDKSAPSKPIVSGNTENWTNSDIELTAQSTDNQSGVSSYSFSDEAGKYDWQNENTKMISDYSKIYVYSKDAAGNISEPCEIDLKIDKLSPTGTVNYDKYNNWVKSVTLTADAADDVSGLHQQAYSFSIVKDEYQWQTENTKTITANGTIYIYARDAAGNITLLDTVTLDKIDSKAPTVNDVSFENIENKTVITIDASDDQSGVAEYSIDNGATWQSGNVFEIEKDSLNFVRVTVRDHVGNTTSVLNNYYYIHTPQIYYDNTKIGLYNPNPNCENEIYYKFSPMSAWTKYEKPFPIAENQKNIYVSFDKANAWYRGTPLTIEHTVNKFAYTESAVDFSLNYNSVSFDIKREYNHDKWEFSFDSSLSVDTNGALISVRTPDFADLVFLKSNKYLYYSESSDNKISVIYNNDTEITEYILNCGDIYYHYAPSGELVKISNAFGDAFDFTRRNNCVIIKDNENRETVLAFENEHLLSVTDADGGVIDYEYSGKNLVKVTDQADVILGRYEYDNGRLSKSNDITVLYDAEGRVVEYLKDNGYSTKMEYDTRDVTITTSDHQTTKISYNIYGNIISSTDTSGKTTTYTYDSRQNLLKASKADEILTECTYNSDDVLISKSDSSGTIYYYYDENNNVIKTKESFSDKEKQDIFTYYVYDENGKVKLQAEYDDEMNNAPEQYAETFKYKAVTKYTYEKGQLVKTEDVDNSTVTTYLYDNYGNIIKSATKIANEDGTESIGIAEDTYDILNRLVLSKTNEKETSYNYDAAGRTLLVKADGEYSRTVYDNYGRVIQEIDNSDYKPELDHLPDAYSDSTAGHTYTYADNGNLVSETNRLGVETEYTYYDNSDTVKTETFDIYVYEYNRNGDVLSVYIADNLYANYVYNEKLVREINYGNGQSVLYDYNEFGQVISQKYKKNEYSQPITQFEYNYTADAETEDDSKLISKINYSLNQITEYNGNKVVISNIKGLDDEGNFIKELYYSYTESEEIENEDETISNTPSEYEFNGASLSVEYNNNSNVFIKDNEKIFSYNYENNSDGYISSSSITDTVNGEEKVILDTTYEYNEKGYITKMTTKCKIDEIISTYKYDDLGRLIEYHPDEESVGYFTYDSKGQLIREDYKYNITSFTNIYKYDDRGNIISQKRYPFTRGEITQEAEKTDIIDFEYENEIWLDEATEVDGEPVLYDSQGNPVKLYECNYNWTNGRQLESVSYVHENGEEEIIWSCTYDENGIRTSKTYEGITTYYTTIDGMITSQYQVSEDGVKSEEMIFMYNESQEIVGVNYDGYNFYYIKNAMGDVIGFIDELENTLSVRYYDAWGNHASSRYITKNGNIESSMSASKLDAINPMRYKGYYYDADMNGYYLQSRYYMSYWYRFLNADLPEYAKLQKNDYAGINLFTYCNNDPINRIDLNGTLSRLQKESLEAQAKNSYDNSKEVRSILNKKEYRDYKYMAGSYSISFEKNYMIATISKVYQSKSNYKKQLGISYMYGKVGDIEKLAQDYENVQKNNLDRQVAFLKVLACFGIILLPVILILAVIISGTDYASNEEAAFLRSKIKGKNKNSYIGFLYSRKDYSF